MRAVNLLPHETQAGRGFAAGINPVVVGGAALTVVVAIALAGGFVLEHGHASSAERQLDTARAQLAQATARQSTHTGTPIVPTPTVAGQIASWKTAVDTALSTRVAYDVLLAQLGRIVPANVGLLSVSIGGTAGTPAAAGSAGLLSIEGTAFSQSGVAQLLARLALLRQVTGVTLTSTSVDAKTGAVSFVISAQLKGATAAFTTATTSAGSGT